MDQEQIWLLTTKYLSKEATEEEIDQLMKIMEEDESAASLFHQMSLIWDQHKKWPSVHSFNAEMDKQRLFERIKMAEKSESPSTGRQVTFTNFHLKRLAAAIIFIVVCAGILFWSQRQEPEEVGIVWELHENPRGRRTVQTLSDGTVVHLNAASRIKYAKSFEGDTREVFLDGEAYFEVAKNPEKPFLVHTQQISTKVLGTSFNIRAFQHESDIEVSLLEGKVEVTGPGQSSMAPGYFLSPAEQYIFHKHNSTFNIHHDVDLTTVIAWKENRLIIDDESLEQVASKLETWFGVTIEIENTAIKNCVLSASFWKTEADVLAAVNSMYEPLTWDDMYGRGFFWYINASDDMVTGRVKSDPDRIKNFICTGNEGYTRNIWANKFKIIKRANDIIINVPEMENISQALKDQAMGEAYFFSGLMYLDLAYRYGDSRAGIPIIDREKPLEFNLPRAANVMENYEYIVGEFEKAAQLLPVFSGYEAADRGRAHKSAANAFMAKTYLYWAQFDPSKYARAVEAADRVIESGEHGLIDTSNPAEDFRVVFSAANNRSREYIWSVVSNTETGSILPGVMFENKGWGKYNGWGYYQPTKELFDEYSEEDARRDVTIFREGTVFRYMGEDFTWYQSSNNVTGYMFGKYTEPFEDAARLNPNGDKPTCDLNVPLMRYAEVLLIKAEALIADGKNGDAPLNEVRTRAGFNPLTGATMKDLKHERRCELAGEWSDRHFDLVRWGDANDVYAQPLHSHDNSEAWPARPRFDPAVHHVWPLPPHEIEASNGVLMQNAGW